MTQSSFPGAEGVKGGERPSTHTEEIPSSWQHRSGEKGLSSNTSYSPAFSKWWEYSTSIPDFLLPGLAAPGEGKPLSPNVRITTPENTSNWLALLGSPALSSSNHYTKRTVPEQQPRLNHMPIPEVQGTGPISKKSGCENVPNNLYISSFWIALDLEIDRSCYIWTLKPPYGRSNEKAMVPGV